MSRIYIRVNLASRPFFRLKPHLLPVPGQSGLIRNNLYLGRYSDRRQSLKRKGQTGCDFNPPNMVLNSSFLPRRLKVSQ